MNAAAKALLAAAQAALDAGSKGELAEHGTCLTDEARKGRLDPVIGRDGEVQQCLEILCRRTKNNPVLVGEPGVGKTAVAEGLAQLMAAGRVPAPLKGYELWSIDVGALTSGTAYRGQLEERMRNLLAAVEDAGRVVVFFDEIHQLVGAGRVSEGGNMDVAQMLKPALARGNFPCIGATTLKEYTRYFEVDAALERRFQKVVVDPPTVLDAIAILNGLRPRLEQHHGVAIAPPAVAAAVELSERYVPDRFLPDKAIDLLDTAAARKAMGPGAAAGAYAGGGPPARQKSTMGVVARKVSRQLIKKVPNPIVRHTLTGLTNKVTAGVTAMSDQLASAKAAVTGGGGLGQAAGGARHVVAEADIAQVLAEWTGIPVQRLGGSEAQGLRQLPAQLAERVKGQPEAVQAVAKAVQRARAGLADPKRPLASFLFLGSTGVGKTELAKALAACLFHTEDAMVRLDMSEFMEKHGVSRLVGSAPGLVGYEDGGQLTDAVRRKPYSIVLLDEVEKAHPDLANILLGVLDDGRLTDSKGRVVSFKNTVVIMTSNLGAASILAASQATTAEEQQQLRQAAFAQVQQHFPPELLNRIDEVVVFRPLGLPQVRDIVRIQVARVAARLADRCMQLQLRDGAVDWLADKGYDPANGARPVKRAIQRELENPLTEGLIDGVFSDGDIIIVDAQPGAAALTLLHGGRGVMHGGQPAGGVQAAYAAGASSGMPTGTTTAPAASAVPAPGISGGIAAAAAAIASATYPAYTFAPPQHASGHQPSAPAFNSYAAQHPPPYQYQAPGGASFTPVQPAGSGGYGPGVGQGPSYPGPAHPPSGAHHHQPQLFSAAPPPSYQHSPTCPPNSSLPQHNHSATATYFQPQGVPHPRPYVYPPAGPPPYGAPSRPAGY